MFCTPCLRTRIQSAVRLDVVVRDKEWAQDAYVVEGILCLPNTVLATFQRE